MRGELLLTAKKAMEAFIEQMRSRGVFIIDTSVSMVLSPNTYLTVVFGLAENL